MTLLPFHILAGVSALGFGYVALYATKGATLHRRSGMLFVYAMVTLSLSGALMDALKTGRISVNVVAGLMTYWLWRLRARKTLPGIVGVSTPLVSGATK